MYEKKIWFVPKIIMSLMDLERKVQIFKIVLREHVKKGNDYSMSLKYDLYNVINYSKDLLKEIN